MKNETLLTVYAVDANYHGDVRLHSATVERETPQFYHLNFASDTTREAYSAFRYRHRLPKSEANLTPVVAWQKFLEQHEAEASYLSRQLENAKVLIDAARAALALAEAPCS